MSHLEGRQAEISVLGAVFLNNATRDRLAGIVTAADFFAPRHQVIFGAMSAVADDGLPIDAVTVAASLEKSGQIEDVGGVDYLFELTQAAATSVNVEHHARIIRDNAEIRRLVASCSGIIEKANRGDYDAPDRLFDEAQAAIFAIGESAQTKAFRAMPDALREVIERVQAAYEVKTTVTGTHTGFRDLDEMTSGLHGGELIILAARPSMGKTALVLNMISNAAELNQCTVAVFSLEMPTAQLTARMLSSDARVESERMRTGHVTDGDIDRLLQSVKKMNQWSIHIDDTAGLSLMDFRSKCRRLAADRQLPKLGLIVIDYLQLMKGPPGARSREQEISAISRGLKLIAKELDCPVVALSQLNRSLESRPNKRPIMSDLRESGAIEQDADVIMFVYRDEVYNEQTEDKGIAEIIVGKQRNGPIGRVRLKFFKQWTRFDNLLKERD